MTQVAIIGGGMITHDQLLPSVYELQRAGKLGVISVCARHTETLNTLARSEIIQRAFPGRTFQPFAGDYKQLVASLPPQSIVIIALPDQIHSESILYSLSCNQHVIAVKPLVLTEADSAAIEGESRQRGLVVAIEYHKRFDDRSLMARRRYREGMFGDFRLGYAVLFEKWYYRHSNFQNWFTEEHTDAFTYIGCHYVDLVHFITGLLPVSVSVCGIRDQFPNGNSGYLWTDARVRWNNGAILNVQNALGFPDAAPGTNTQGLILYCAGQDTGAWLKHDDQYRGIQYCSIEGGYTEPSPDYFQYVSLGGPGLKPVGYGYRSVEFLVERCLEAAALGAVEDRRRFLKELDETGIVATPANSRYNEQVIAAGRRSLAQDGLEVRLDS